MKLEKYYSQARKRMRVLTRNGFRAVQPLLVSVACWVNLFFLITSPRPSYTNPISIISRKLGMPNTCSTHPNYCFTVL